MAINKCSEAVSKFKFSFFLIKSKNWSANLVIEIGNKQKHLFGATTRSFCLSEKGAAFVDGLNLNF